MHNIEDMCHSVPIHNIGQACHFDPYEMQCIMCMHATQIPNPQIYISRQCIHRVTQSYNLCLFNVSAHINTSYQPKIQLGSHLSQDITIIRL
uniref:Putative ovule protein n=1 Tax=Solanum chacoense TaxID=4108 RepID=A0A0V0H6J2_SOLCH